MGSVIDFAAINTKIRVMERNFFSKEELQRLISCNTYKDSLKFLKENTHLSKILNKYDVDDLHRGQLEIILKRDYIENITKLRHFLSEKYRKLLEIMFIRFEVEDIKIILRGKFIGKSVEELSKLIMFHCSLSNVDYETLLNARDVNDVLGKLKNTIYYKYLSNSIKKIDNESLFHLEMTLDLVYFLKLKNYIKKLSKEDREIMEKLNGVNCDLLNIQWIFRGIKYYRLQPEILYNYTIFDGWRLKKEYIRDLCYCRNLNEFYSKISTTPYKCIFEKSNFNEHLLEIEILTYLKSIYRKYKTEHEMNISVVIAYLELALLEYRDIISIVENKRYSQQSNDILKYITATI